MDFKYSKEVRLGQQVQAWFAGIEHQSYPGQAIASKISFKPIEKPHKATLSEEEVIRLALKNENNSNIVAFIINEVKYDEASDVWSIRYKEGVHAEEELENRLIIPDK